MATPAEIENARFGRDLVLAETTNRGIGGRAPTLAGRANLYQWLLNTARTTAGDLVHRPDWGGDLTAFLGLALTPDNLARMQSRLRRAWLRDPRVADAFVSVEPSEGSGQVVLTAQVVLAGEDSEITLEEVVDLALDG